MFCTNCGKSIEPDTRFCPHCGTRQASVFAPPAMEGLAAAAPAAALASTSGPAVSRPVPVAPAPSGGVKPAVWAGAVALVLSLVGGVGYWGWSNKVAGEQAAQKVAQEEQARKAALDEATRKLDDEAQRRVAAEKSAEVAEITAAQAMLDRHIAAEEAQAQAAAAKR
jgi:hypothetical protein